MNWYVMSQTYYPKPPEPDDSPDAPFPGIPEGEDLTAEATREAMEERAFILYLVVQRAGCFNMITQAQEACDASGLTGRQYKWVMRHCTELEAKYPDAEPTAVKAVRQAGRRPDRGLLEDLLWLRRAVRCIQRTM